MKRKNLIAKRGEFTSGETMGEKTRILLLDDQNQVLESATEVLARSHHSDTIEFVCCTSAEEAHKIIEEDVKISHLVTDIHMPEINGIQFLQRLHLELSERYSTMQIFALCSSPNDTEREQLREIGVTQWLTKPLDVNLFLDILETLESPKEKKGRKFMPEPLNPTLGIVQDLCRQIIEEGDLTKSPKADTLLSTLAMQLFPHGTILPWFQTMSKTPEGWYICDGTNDTPNLLNRLLIGAPDASSAGRSSTLSFPPASEDNESKEAVGVLFIMRNCYL